MANLQNKQHVEHFQEPLSEQSTELVINKNTVEKTKEDMNDTLIYDIGNNRYINLCNKCTLRCRFCPKNHDDWQVHEYDLSLGKSPKALDILAQLGDVSQFDEIVFCGFGESTLRLKELLFIAKEIKQQGGKTRLNTDGLANLVYGRNVLPDMAEVIDAISISLNAQDEATYNKHCLPTLPNSYQGVRDFIRLAPTYINDVQVSAIDGLEGVDIKACQAIVEAAGAKFKRRVMDEVG